jgi:hypothetical protein
MIIQRLTFQTKYGQGDALVGLIRQSIKDLGNQMGVDEHRVYTDLTGPMFTVIWDQSLADMRAVADMQERMLSFYQTPEFQRFFEQMQPLVEHGERQLLTQVDL